MTTKALFRRFPLVSLAAFALTCSAQVAGAPGNFPESPGASQRAPQSAGSAPASPAPPAAQAAATTPGQPAYAASPLLDTPAKPAEITLNQGQLSIKANNSSLTDILHHLAKKTGMTIDGLSRDQRIFGVYGPGTPREILSELLDGAGYNVLMLGDTDSGAPRELQLSARSNGPAPAGQATTIAQQQDDDQDDNAPPPPPNYTPAGEGSPHPAALAPNQAPTPNGGVKSPQELLQELQRMRQQQQQQQQQQPQ